MLRYQVLFFRKQTVTPAQQRDFAGAFGKLHRYPVFPTVEDVPEAIVLDTARNDLKDNALWHTDVTFAPEPPMGAVLAARLLPSGGGGDTLWASGTAAWRALSPAQQQRLAPLVAEHDFTYSFPPERYARDSEEKRVWEETRAAFPPVLHPVVRRHPETGEAALFVNEGFTSRLVGLEAEESRRLLQELFQHTTKPEFFIRWRWEEGDIAFWDNRVTQHYAVDDYRPARRVMHRVTLLGDRPVGMFERDREGASLAA